MWKTINSGKVWRGEFENRKKDGSHYWESASISPTINDEGKITHFVAVKEDITKRKQQEEQLKIAKELAESANKAKSTFIANVSHEIRTPMNAIIGFSEILEKMIKDTTQKKYLNSIRSSGNALLNLINDILDISKMEAGRLVIKKEPVSIKIMAEEMINMFALKTREKGLNLKKSIDDLIPDYLELDELRMRQVLINLLNNAIKFTDSGFIELEINVLNRSKDLINLIINIKDTGIGISKKDQKEIFGSFKQAEEQDARKYGGTGLGLSISKKIVELLGGKIIIDSKLNKGSTFTIDIPNVKISKNVESKLDKKFKYKPEEVSFEKASILVVDDIENNRDVVKGYLLDYDFKISEAINGKQAVDMAKRLLPDLIFMDIKMPVMDGYEATQLIKKNKQTSHIPIIALTASSYIKSKDDIIPKGFDGYILKPIKTIELVNELTHFINFKEIRSDQTEQVENEIEIPDNLLVKLPEIIKKLETVKKENWVNLRRRQTLKDAKKFNLQLISLNTEYEIPFLIEYTNKFSEAIASFDIEDIKDLIFKYPDFIKILME